MKTKKNKFLTAILTTLFFAAAVQAQTTAFNYQGRLTDGGNPANGSFQMQFKLFDALAGGNQIGGTISDVPITATNGVFSTKLDFGSSALSGANRWLEIAVRRNSGESYITLAPREQIASSPYAVRTLSAASADNALQLGGINANQFINFSNLGTNAVLNQSSLQSPANFNIGGNGLIGGNLGIGTTLPQSRLSVFTPANNYGLTHTDGTVTVGTYIGSGTGWFGTRSNHSLHFFTNDSAPRMTIDTVGNVAIGSAGITASSRLYLEGGPSWTSNGWSLGLAFSNISALGWTPNASGQRFGIGQTGGGLYFFRTNAGFGTNTSPANYDMLISDAGNIGIGTLTPSAKLQIAGTGTNGFTLGVEGNATQNRDKGGFVKAMLAVFDNGTIVRCYNGLTGSSSGNCGFTVTHFTAGGYGINFGFQVNDRFFVITPGFFGTPINNNYGADFEIPSSNTINVRTFSSGNSTGTVDTDFIIMVF